MKTNINREILLNYIYEHGFERACEILKISLDKANDIIDPKPDTVYYERKAPKKVSAINRDMAEVIDKNYHKLRKEFLRNNECESFDELEDAFQNAILSLLQEFPDVQDDLYGYIQLKLKGAKMRHYNDCKSYRKVVTNITPETEEIPDDSTI